MLVGLFLINLFFTFIINKNKYYYFFIIHPSIYFIILMAIRMFGLLNTFYIQRNEEKKITKEIPTLIDFLKSYMIAGLLLPNALEEVLKNKKWCRPISDTLNYICSNYMQGKSFKESLTNGINLVKYKKSRQYLCLLFVSLRLGYSTGENLTQILEKVKNKTQDRINLERKLKVTTAQMRLQATVIILSPLFLSIIVYFISPEYILFFFRTSMGLSLFILMIFMNICGAYFLNRILRIK